MHKVLFFICVLLGSTLFAQEVDSTTLSVNFLNKKSSAPTLYKVDLPIYSYTYDKNIYTNFVYVECSLGTDSSFTYIANVADYVDALGILNDTLDTGLYTVKVYLSNNVNPLYKGKLLIEQLHAVVNTKK